MGQGFSDKDLLNLRPNLLKFACKLCPRHRDMAEDLVQDTMIKAISHRDRFQDGTNLKAWLFTILKHQHFSIIRRTKTRNEQSLIDPEGLTYRDVGVDGNQEWYCMLKDAEHMLSTMRPEHRHTLVEIAVNGLSYEEVAEKYSLLIGTVKSRMTRARDYLENDGCGVYLEPTVEIADIKDMDHISVIKEQYCREGLSIREIASLLNVERSLVMETILQHKFKPPKELVVND